VTANGVVLQAGDTLELTETRQLIEGRLYVFPPSGRVLGVLALKNHLEPDYEVQAIDLFGV
jgi:hypothetical protein